MSVLQKFSPTKLSTATDDKQATTSRRWGKLETVTRPPVSSSLLTRYLQLPLLYMHLRHCAVYRDSRSDINLSGLASSNVAGPSFRFIFNWGTANFSPLHDIQPPLCSSSLQLASHRWCEAFTPSALLCISIWSSRRGRSSIVTDILS